MSTMDPARRAALSGVVLGAMRAAFGDHLRGAILKGSALKGDFIPYYSDFDVHAFVDTAAMQTATVPAVERALAFQAAIGAVEPRDYGVNALQIFFIAWDRFPADWVKPLPGTYTLIAGELPAGFTDIDPADYLVSAESFFASLLSGWYGSLVSSLLDKPNAALPRLARLAGTYLKPAPYAAATLTTGDPVRVWRLPLAEVLPLIAPPLSPSGSLAGFYQGAREWLEVEREPVRARPLLRLALAAMAEALDWYRARPAGRGAAGQLDGSTGPVLP